MCRFPSADFRAHVRIKSLFRILRGFVCPAQAWPAKVCVSNADMCSACVPNVVSRGHTKLCVSMQSSDYFDLYIEKFFTGRALHNFVAYMCNMCTMEVTDPVCSTLSTLVSTPIIFKATSIGLIPLKNMSMSVLPYSAMTRGQCLFLLGYIAYIEQNDIGVTNRQMGGGFVVTLQKQHSRTHMIDHTTMLESVFKNILNNVGYANIEVRQNICSIILQRVSANTCLSRDCIHKVHIMMRKTAVDATKLPGQCILDNEGNICNIGECSGCVECKYELQECDSEQSRVADETSCRNNSRDSSTHAANIGHETC